MDNLSFYRLRELTDVRGDLPAIFAPRIGFDQLHGRNYCVTSQAYKQGLWMAPKKE